MVCSKNEIATLKFKGSNLAFIQRKTKIFYKGKIHFLNYCCEKSDFTVWENGGTCTSFWVVVTMKRELFLQKEME